MKRIICLLVLTIFLVGCACSEESQFCISCHDGWCDISEYTMDPECIKCHEVDVCERGNSWRQRKSKNVPKKYKSRKNKRR